MIDKVKKVESKILALKELLEKAKRPDEYDPYADEGDDELAGLSIRDEDEMQGDAADEWLKANDPDQKKEAAPKDEPTEAPAKSDTAATPKKKEPGKAPDDNIKDIAKHWLNRAEQHRAQTASAKKNPVLHAEGHRQAAHNAAHTDYNKAYADLKNSDKYKGMSKAGQRRAERDFKRNWHKENPEHLANASTAVGEAHKKYGEARDVYNKEQEQQTAHVLRGGDLGGEKMSDEAASQSVGGSVADGEKPSNIQQTTEAAFANANSNFADDKRKFLEFVGHLRDSERYQKMDPKSRAKAERDLGKDWAEHQGENKSEHFRDMIKRVYNNGKELADKPQSVVSGSEDVEDLANPDKNLFDHPVLNKPESQKALNDFTKQHQGLMQGNVRRFMSGAKAKGIADKLDESDLNYHALHGLMAAARDYDPSLGHKFETYASSKMQGLMNTHAASQHPVPRKLREEAKRHMKSQNMEQVKTKAEAQAAQPETASQEVATQPEAPKTPSVNDLKLGAKKLEALNHIKAIRRPKGDN